MVEEARGRGVAAIAAVGTAGLRMRTQPPTRSSRRCASGPAIEVEIDHRRRGGPARVPRRRRLGLRLGDGSLGRVRHRRRQLAVHVRRTASRSRSGSASTSAPSGSPSASASTASSRRRCCAEALDAIAADLDASRRPRRRRTTLVGIGGAVTNLAAVEHGLATYDPDVVQGTVLDRAEVDRQIELYRTRTADERRADRRPPAEARRGDPRRRLRRANRAREARPRLAHRQRPGPAPRVARESRSGRQTGLTVALEPVAAEVDERGLHAPADVVRPRRRSSFRKIPLMCRSTARFVIPSDSAIELLLRPSAIRARISSSRGVSFSIPESLRCRAETSLSTTRESTSERPAATSCSARLSSLLS